MNELGFGEFKESTRTFFVEQVHQLAARGAQGVVMGCTEIELLLRQQERHCRDAVVASLLCCHAVVVPFSHRDCAAVPPMYHYCAAGASLPSIGVHCPGHKRVRPPTPVPW